MVLSADRSEHTAGHEFTLMSSPAGVEDFILCVFKHTSNVTTLPILSFNHQQNKAR